MEIDKGIIIKKLNIKDGDTIIVTIDMDIWDINTASEMCKIVSKVFPNNNVVTTFKGIEISAGAGPSPE
jgi:short-subunit dehydrogenase involved in D-alanine esterification of teichoic acids